MIYTLYVEEPVWQLREYNEKIQQVNGYEVNGEVSDVQGNYWIESEARDVILEVGSMPQGEEIINALKTDEILDLEEAEKEFEHAEIRVERPPQEGEV